MKKQRTVLQAKRYGIHSCAPTTTLLTAARRMVDDEISYLVVVDDAGWLLGVVSRLDILRAHMASDDWSEQPVTRVMRTETSVATPQTLLAEVADRLLSGNTDHVVVVLIEGGMQRPVAIITATDLVYHLVMDS